MWTCKNCGAKVVDDAREFCFDCMTPRGQQKTGLKNMFSESLNEKSQNRNYFMSMAQGYILIGLACIAILLLAWNTFKPATLPKYAYKVINVQSQFNKSSASDTDLNTTSVNIKDEELSILGNEGWELVGTFLEMETTHPNYGNSQYVTGLQPNIRPQRAVMIFRKQL